MLLNKILVGKSNEGNELSGERNWKGQTRSNVNEYSFLKSELFILLVNFIKIVKFSLTLLLFDYLMW